MKEYTNSIINKNYSTGLSQHCTEKCHISSLSDYQILHLSEKEKRLEFLERLKIIKTFSNKD